MKSEKNILFFEKLDIFEKNHTIFHRAVETIFQ